MFRVNNFSLLFLNKICLFHVTCDMLTMFKCYLYCSMMYKMNILCLIQLLVIHSDFFIQVLPPKNEDLVLLLE